MIWKNYSHQIPPGSHAPFSASNYHWLNYDNDKAIEYIRNMKAKERGTRLHAWAAESIRLKRPQSGRDTLAKYINDSITLNMDPEILLYYSPYFFGTTDAIGIDSKGTVRINDLKTGVTPASIKQLYIYDALYCLDYGINPVDVPHELRIYQNDDVHKEKPKGKDILVVMDKIKTFNKLITEIPEEGLML